MNERISVLTLEKYMLGELSPESSYRIEKLIGANPEVGEMISALEKSNREILKKYPPVNISKTITERYREKMNSGPMEGTVKNISPRKVIIPAALAAAAAAAFFFISPLLMDPYVSRDAVVGDDAGTTRIKGLVTGIEIFRKNGSAAEVLGDGSPVRKGDLLQISYFSHDKKFGSVISIDGRGTAVLHYPMEGGRTTIFSGRKILLPNSYELDDAPRFERFFLVLSGKEFNAADVLSAAKKLASDGKRAETGKLGIDSSFEQHSIRLQKVR
ncbi:MAG: hypothetical protein MUD12_14120 [Spirochaetes bacterium]|jgi:hypothetical protein|nr:hypothetical protein [Spirochaetota bacterium]